MEHPVLVDDRFTAGIGSVILTRVADIVGASAAIELVGVTGITGASDDIVIRATTQCVRAVFPVNVVFSIPAIEGVGMIATEEPAVLAVPPVITVHIVAAVIAGEEVYILVAADIISTIEAQNCVVSSEDVDVVVAICPVAVVAAVGLRTIPPRLSGDQPISCE
jgi:hypothetical protein